jgi:hypothetical protein
MNELSVPRKPTRTIIAPMVPINSTSMSFGKYKNRHSKRARECLLLAHSVILSRDSCLSLSAQKRKLAELAPHGLVTNDPRQPSE